MLFATFNTFASGFFLFLTWL